MSMSVAKFRQQRPEFRQLPDDRIAGALAYAERGVSATTFPAPRRDDVVSLVAARFLADSPMGMQAKLQLEDGRTVYDKELDRLKRAYSMGHRVP